MSREQTWQTVKPICKSYWCLFCLQRSVAAMSTSGPYALKIFRSCRAHHHRYQQKRCPCDKLWSACLACFDNGVDPRAGSAFCGACRRRYGAASTTTSRFCACRLLPAASALTQQGAPGDAAPAVASDDLETHSVEDDSDVSSDLESFVRGLFI
jgi:hypothetical protein